MTLIGLRRTIGITSCRNVGRARRFPNTRCASTRLRSVSGVILDDRTEGTDTETVDNSRAIGSSRICRVQPLMATHLKSPTQPQRSRPGSDSPTPLVAPRRGGLFVLLWPLTSHLVTNVTVT